MNLIISFGLAEARPIAAVSSSRIEFVDRP